MTTEMKTNSQQYLARIAARIESGLLAAERPETSQEFAHLTLREEQYVRDYLNAAISFRAGRLSADSLVGMLGRMFDHSAK